MLSGLKYNVVRNAAIIRLTQMNESIEDIVNSYTKLDESQKEMLTAELTARKEALEQDEEQRDSE